MAVVGMVLWWCSGCGGAVAVWLVVVRWLCGDVGNGSGAVVESSQFKRVFAKQSDSTMTTNSIQTPPGYVFQFCNYPFYNSQLPGAQ